MKKGVFITKTRTSEIGAISKAQEAQRFLNMLRTYSWKALKTLSRHPKCAFHARYDWKICFPTGNKIKFENFFGNFFLKKTSKMSHSAEKWKGGTFWDSLTYILLQNIKKLEGGLFWDLEKFSKKNFAQCRKKLKGGPFGLFRFCRLCKKGKKWKGGPFALSFHWPDLAWVVLSVSVKSGTYAMSSVFWRKKRKKLATVKVGLFSLKEKVPTKNGVGEINTFFSLSFLPFSKCIGYSWAS